MPNLTPQLIFLRSAVRAARKHSHIPIVPTLHQIGPIVTDGPIKMFLDDVRNPPYKEKDWVIVRNVPLAQLLIEVHGSRIVEMSLDNDLGQELEGYLIAQFVMDYPYLVPNLKRIILHSGNLLKVQRMRKILHGSSYHIVRKEPSRLIYPNASNDVRDICSFNPFI